MNGGFHYHPGAREDAREAVEFYRRISYDLAERFVAFLEESIALIVSEPAIGHPVRAGCRQKVFIAFPYSIIYRLAKDEIQIVAVMHHRRKPTYWLERVR